MKNSRVLIASLYDVFVNPTLCARRKPFRSKRMNAAYIGGTASDFPVQPGPQAPSSLPTPPSFQTPPVPRCRPSVSSKPFFQSQNNTNQNLEESLIDEASPALRIRRHHFPQESRRQRRPGTRGTCQHPRRRSLRRRRSDGPGRGRPRTGPRGNAHSPAKTNPVEASTSTGFVLRRSDCRSTPRERGGTGTAEADYQAMRTPRLQRQGDSTSPPSV